MLKIRDQIQQQRKSYLSRLWDMLTSPSRVMVDNPHANTNKVTRKKLNKLKIYMQRPIDNTVNNYATRKWLKEMNNGKN